MAEITRHRLASFAIESQRYVCMSGDIAFIRPLFYSPGDGNSEFWRSSMEDAEKSYHTLLERGCKPEDARKLLPNSTATRIIMKANLREWRHVFAMRTGKAAYSRSIQTDTRNGWSECASYFYRLILNMLK